MKLSICLPTYHGVSLIGDALESIFLDKFQDYEVIISNDSPDDHLQMEEKLKSYKDARVKFFANEENLGYPLNLRKTTRMAKNEILFLMAQDDILLNDALFRTINAFSLGENIGAVTRPYYQFFDNLKKPVRVIPPLNKGKDVVVSVFDGKETLGAILKTLGQLTGLAYRKEFIEADFHEEVFPAHIYPFLSIAKKHKIAFLGKYSVAVRITSSQTRFKSSIYDISPTASWVKMFKTIYRGHKYEEVRKQSIKFICTTNFVGLAQIKNYSSLKNLLREIWLLIKFYPRNLINSKFWFFSFGAIFIPRKILIWVIDFYKNKFF